MCHYDVLLPCRRDVLLADAEVLAVALEVLHSTVGSAGFVVRYSHCGLLQTLLRGQALSQGEPARRVRDGADQVGQIIKALHAAQSRRRGQAAETLRASPAGRIVSRLLDPAGLRAVRVREMLHSLLLHVCCIIVLCRWLEPRVRCQLAATLADLARDPLLASGDMAGVWACLLRFQGLVAGLTHHDAQLVCDPAMLPSSQIYNDIFFQARPLVGY